MNNKRHVDGSYHLGNSRSFRNPVPEMGKDQIYILTINHNITLSFRQLSPHPLSPVSVNGFTAHPASQTLADTCFCPLGLGGVSYTHSTCPSLSVPQGLALFLPWFFTIISSRAPFLCPTISIVRIFVEMREKMGREERGGEGSRKGGKIRGWGGWVIPEGGRLSMGLGSIHLFLYCWNEDKIILTDSLKGEKRSAKGDRHAEG